MNGVDTVVDTLASAPSSSLSIQSLERATSRAVLDHGARGSRAHGHARSSAAPLASSANTFDDASFIIYPNPVKASVVHARVTTNTRAHVALSIFTLEGQAAAHARFDVNPNGVVDTPFDEAIDVAHLKSGVYLMRLEIESIGGRTARWCKTFAIRR